jgi:hypothetical protein
LLIVMLTCREGLLSASPSIVLILLWSRARPIQTSIESSDSSSVTPSSMMPPGRGGVRSVRTIAMHSSTFLGFNAKSRKAVCYRTGQLSGSYQLCWAPVTPPQVYVANAKEADPPLYQPSSEVVALFAGMVTHDVDGRKFMNFAKTIIQVPPGVTVNQDHKVSLHWIVSMGVLTWLTWKRCVVLCCVVLCCVGWLVGW